MKTTIKSIGIMMVALAASVLIFFGFVFWGGIVPAEDQKPPQANDNEIAFALHSFSPSHFGDEIPSSVCHFGYLRKLWSETDVVEYGIVDKRIVDINMRILRGADISFTQIVD
jgi:hypothetical protein